MFELTTDNHITIGSLFLIFLFNGTTITVRQRRQIRFIR